VTARPRPVAFVAGLVLIAGLAAACATTTASRPTQRARDSTEAEARLVSAALSPLLAVLDDATVFRPGCKIPLGIWPTPRINASVARSTSGDCPSFALVVTEGALTRLPVPMLRAILAHEIGHVALGHSGSKSQAKETEADEFAVKLLKRLDGRYPEACVQLVYVFSVLAESPSLASAWLSDHPSPDRRAEAALAGCNR
jgi:Zn-dependent protease with chaperone function